MNGGRVRVLVSFLAFGSFCGAWGERLAELGGGAAAVGVLRRRSGGLPGPALFAASASAGRALGHRLLAGRQDRLVLACGALVGAAGTFVAALAPAMPIALGGLVVAGLGTSVCAPTVLSLAGRTASAVSLRAALAGVGVVAVALAVSCRLRAT